MNQVLNELIGIPDLVNLIEEYTHRGRLCWMSQFDHVIRDINYGCVQFMLWRFFIIRKLDYEAFYALIPKSYLLNYDELLNELRDTFDNVDYSKSSSLRWFKRISSPKRG